MTDNCQKLYNQRHIVQQVGRRLVLPAPEIRRNVMINGTSNVLCHWKAEANNKKAVCWELCLLLRTIWKLTTLMKMEICIKRFFCVSTVDKTKFWDLNTVHTFETYSSELDSSTINPAKVSSRIVSSFKFFNFKLCNNFFILRPCVTNETYQRGVMHWLTPGIYRKNEQSETNKKLCYYQSDCIEA